MSRRLTLILGWLVAIAASLAAAPANAALASGGWSSARQISDVPMEFLDSAVDSRGNVHVVGADAAAHSALFYLTNASGQWVQSEIAHAPRAGGFSELGIAVDRDDSVWVTYTRWLKWDECGIGCNRNTSKRDAAYVINNVSGKWSRPTVLPRAFTKLGWDFTVRDGDLYFAYETPGIDISSSIWFATNAAGAWRKVRVSLGWGPHIALDADGRTWIGYTAHEYAGGAVVARSNLKGTRFVHSRAPGTKADSGTASVDGFGLDSAGRPVALFDRYEQKSGYWTYSVRLGTSGWSSPQRIFNNYGFESAIDGNDNVHYLYDVSDYGRTDGLYYGVSSGGIGRNVRIDRSYRSVEDAPSAAESLSVDRTGRPHVVFAIPYNDNRIGLWYLVGPGPG